MLAGFLFVAELVVRVKHRSLLQTSLPHLWHKFVLCQKPDGQPLFYLRLLQRLYLPLGFALCLRIF